MPHKPFGLSVKALISDAEGRCLVIRRVPDSKFWPGQWDLPGGKIDQGETFDQALLREAREETGLKIRLTRFVGASAWELPHVQVVFVVMAAVIDGGTLGMSKEHEEYKWISMTELKSLDLVDPIAEVVRSSAGGPYGLISTE
jgi:8-oxo-dGTP diphosphatase